jgi:hypothetical protein
MGQVSQTYDGTQCTKWGDVKVNQSDDHFRAASSIKLMLEASADDYFKLQATHWQTQARVTAQVAVTCMARNVTTDQPCRCAMCLTVRVPQDGSSVPQASACPTVCLLMIA